jgi:hypothetical protein
MPYDANATKVGRGEGRGRDGGNKEGAERARWEEISWDGEGERREREEGTEERGREARLILSFRPTKGWSMILVTVKATLIDF